MDEKVVFFNVNSNDICIINNVKYFEPYLTIQDSDEWDRIEAVVIGIDADVPMKRLSVFFLTNHKVQYLPWDFPIELFREQAKEWSGHHIRRKVNEQKSISLPILLIKKSQRDYLFTFD